MTSTTTGIITVVINVQQIVQTFISTPFSYEKCSQTSPGSWKIHKKFEKIKKRKISEFPLTWYLGNSVALYVFLFSFFHLSQLINRLINAQEFKSFEEILVYVMILAMCAQCIVTWHTFERDPGSVVYLITELPKVCGIEYAGWPSFKRPPMITELLGYGMFFGLGLFPVVTGIFPWLRSYDPLSIFLATFLPELPRRIGSSLLTALFTLFGAAIGGHALLGIVVGALCLIQIINQNLGDSSRTIESWSIYQNDLKSQFRRSYRLHCQLRILIRMINEEYSVYIPVLQLVGILFCVFGNFGVVAFHGKMELVMVSFCFVVSISFTVFNFIILSISSIPNVKTQELIWLWKGNVGRLGQVEKREVRAMPVLYLKVGRFYKIKNTSGMQVLNCIMDFTMQTVTIWNQRE